MLVGSVRVFVRQAEADKHAGYFESVMHLRDERDGAAFANKDGFFSEAFFERALGDLKDGRMEGRYPRFTGAEHFEFALYGLRQEFPNVLFDELRGRVGILLGNQTSGKFREGFRGDDRLCALALIAPPHAVQFKSGARPELFDDGRTFFAGVARRANGFFERFLLPGKSIQGFAFGRGNLRDLVVEARNGDAEVFVVKLGEQFTENRQRIRDRSAIYAGMQIARGTGEFDLVVIQSTQSIGYRRDALGEHRGIGNDERVGLELLLVLLHVVPEADASDFLFAFDQNFYIDRQLSVHFHDGFERLQMNVDLAFVIGGAAAEKIAIAHGRFEGGRGPKIERFRRLHIIVAVEEDRGLAGDFERFGINERMEICRNNFNFLETGGAKIVGHPASRTFDVRLVLALGADTGDPQEFAKLCQMLVAMTFYILGKVRHRALGGHESFQIKSNET